jgi:hypothetical protein
VDDRGAAFVLDAPVVRDAGLRVLAQLDRAVAVRGLGLDDLDDESHFVRREPGAVSGVVGRRQQLALRRSTPLRLMPCLEDAHRRGVLRQAGAVYQFRHARLQQRLAGEQPKPTPGG